MKKVMAFVVSLVFLLCTSAFAVEKAAAPVKEEPAKVEATKKEVKKAPAKQAKKAKKAAKKATKPAEEKAKEAVPAK